MRCRKVRQAIIRLDGILSDNVENKAFRDHLKVCDKCSRFAEAERILHDDLVNPEAYDNTMTDSIDEIRAQVETRLSAISPNLSKESNIMSKIYFNLTQKPRYGVSTALIIIILLVVTLVPFKWEKTIGYKVALAAVDKDMALNEDKLNDFLIMLGINGAEFVVDGCEEKCKLTISNLKSKDEANIIIAAFDEFGNTVLKELTPIIEDQSITILKRINLKLTNDIKNENNIKNNVNLYILDLLKNLNDSEKVKIGPWVSKKSGDSGFGVLKIVDEDSNPLQIGYYLGTQEIGDYSNFDVSNDSNYVSYNIRHYFEGDDELVSLEKDGIMTLYNLNNPDDVAHLDSLGITINTARICNGEFPAVIYTPKKALMPSESQKSDKATEDILPDEYRLEQNYPNPFNPTTTIIFSLPISEKVTLEIFNFEGRLVRTLINDVKDAGIHYIIWDGRNDKGGKVASGMYVYKITAGDFIDTKKMTLIK